MIYFELPILFNEYLTKLLKLRLESNQVFSFYQVNSFYFYCELLIEFILFI
jgi:hypothetical protein